MADHASESPETQWRTAGERIETLLDALSVGGPAARERGESLVREVAGLYGAGLGRIVALSDAPALQRYADDDLVASLLLVHGLHPHDVRRRVATALDSVRPYLGSHGGDVELLEVAPGPAEELTVRLRFAGSCKSCPSSAATLELTVEDAVRAAAPEVTAIEVVTESASGTAVIPAETLFGRVHPAPPSWHPVPELAELAPGDVAGFDVGGLVILACRVADELFAYRDHCPSCGGSLAGAVLHGAVLGCPNCRTRFDVVHAGAGIDMGDGHLEPLPLLPRDGVLSLAIAAEPTGMPA